MSAVARRAIVLGGGIAGLSAAIALRDAGYGVSVHEQADAIAPLGAAISLWPNAVAALRRLSALGPIEAEAAPITALRLATRAGRPILKGWSIDADRHGERAYLPTRAMVQRALQAALGSDVPFHLGQRVVEVRDDGACAVAQFEDGQQLRADLVIAANGVWSEVASKLLGNPPRPRGYGGVLALSDPVDGPWVEGLAAEYWGKGERFGVFDLGARRSYWFYMASEPLPELSHADLLDKAEGWPGAVGAAVAATPVDRLIPVSIAARPVPSRLARGRVICVGDAAHGMEPNLGQGACQALEDAVALGAIAVDTPPEDVAAQFDRVRRRRVAGMMRRAAEGGLAVHGPVPVQAAMRLILRSMPLVIHRRMIDAQYRLPAY